MRNYSINTSPDFLNSKKEAHFGNSYISPKNIYSSPKHDNQKFYQNYESMSKVNHYNNGNSQLNNNQMLSSSKFNAQGSSEILAIEQSKAINELKTMLFKSQQGQKILQQQLYRQKQKNYELSEMKRRLEQEISRLDFELQRIGNYQVLEYKENMIKFENTNRENVRLSSHVNELVEQIKSIKKQLRKVMSENDCLSKDNQILETQNDNLIHSLTKAQKQLVKNRNYMDKAENDRSIIYQNQKSRNKIKINGENLENTSMQQLNIPTSRTNNMPTIHQSNIKSYPVIQEIQQSDEIYYEEENKKLIEDYSKLLEQNQSMKKLYNQFYTNKPEAIQKKEKEERKRDSFTNRAIKEKLNTEEENYQQVENNYQKTQNELFLQTRQRQQLSDQLKNQREQVIDYLLNHCYKKCLNQSEANQKNSLKLFIKEINRHYGTLEKMCQNYLEMRQNIKQEVGVNSPKQYNEIKINNESEVWVDKIYKSIKDNAKKDSNKNIGYHLALFRLLTLICKVEDINGDIFDNMKHSVLKYIYKIKETSN